MKRIATIALMLCMALSMLAALPAAAEEYDGIPAAVQETVDEFIIEDETVEEDMVEEDLPVIGATDATGFIQSGDANELPDYSNLSTQWMLWDEAVFDHLESDRYTIGTNANFESSIIDGALTFTKTGSSGSTTWNNALRYNFPEGKKLTDGKYYIEYTFQSDIKGSNGTGFNVEMNNGSNLILRTIARKTNNAIIQLILRESIAADTATAVIPTSRTLSNYEHGTITTVGTLHDTEASSINMYMNRVEHPYQFYTATKDATGIDNITFNFRGSSDTGQYARIYSLRIWREIDDPLLIADGESLMVDQLTDEPTNAITENLHLPVELTNGTMVSWSSDAEDVISKDGTVMLQNGDREVILTATLTRGALSTTKQFLFTVLDAEKANRFLYVSRDTFDAEEDLATWSYELGDGSVTGSGRRMCLQRNGEYQEVSATKYFVTQDKNNRFGATGENVTVEYQLEIDDYLSELKAELLDTADTVVSDLTWNNTGLTVSYNDGNADTMAVTGYTAGAVIDVKYEINTTTGAMKAYIDGTLLADGFTRNGSRNISALKFSTGYEGAGGAMYLDNVNLLIESTDKVATKLELDKQILTFENIKGSEKNKESAIVENLSLVTRGTMGSNIIWRSSDETVLSSEGMVTRGSEDQQVTLTAILQNETRTDTVEFLLTVRGIDESNLALGATVLASSGKSTANNVNDTLLDLAWIAGSMNPYLRLDLGEIKTISRIVLYELDDNGDYRVTGYTIEMSENGTSWTTLTEGSAVGAKKVIDFLPVETRYIRYQVTSQETGYTGLYEFEVYCDPSDALQVQADMEWLRSVITGYTVSSALELPTVGYYGSKISWKSSNTAVMSDDGLSFTRPSKDTTFVMTATVSNNDYAESQPFSKLALGTNSSSSQSGGSGGGGGSSSALGSSGGLVNYIPDSGYTPTATPTPTSTPTPPDISDNYGTFYDVPRDGWSFEYVEALAGKGIVNGYAGAFYPEDSVTREEFVKMLLGALEIEVTETATDFSDVDADAWYAPYVATAAQLGIAEGSGDGTFGVGQTIIRQDVALMVERALEIMGVTLHQDSETIAFNDAQSISGYAKDAIDMLVRANVLSGDENNWFHPMESLTREQAAKIICLSGGIMNEE